MLVSINMYAVYMYFVLLLWKHEFDFNCFGSLFWKKKFDFEGFVVASFVFHGIFILV